jgi:hypothetical protein
MGIRYIEERDFGEYEVLYAHQISLFGSLALTSRRIAFFFSRELSTSWGYEKWTRVRRQRTSAYYTLVTAADFKPSSDFRSWT